MRYRGSPAIKIEAYADKDRDHSGNKDSLVDLQDKVTESPEEKYERDVDKPGDKLRDRWQAFGAFVQKQSNSRSLQRVARLLEDAHISPNPLLNERCKEGGRSTAYEAYEPEDIHSAVRRRYMKGRVRLWGSKIGWHLAARGELLRYSIKQLNGLLLVIG